MKRGLTQFAGRVVADLWVAAARERVRHEWELLAAVLCDPARGLELADQRGVDASWFGEEDLRTIYLAAIVCRTTGFGRPVDGLTGCRADRLRIYRLARVGLQADGHWDPDSRQWYGPLWSDETLSALFDAEFSSLFVPARAGQLDALAARQRDALEHLRYAWRILGSSTEAVG